MTGTDAVARARAVIEAAKEHEVYDGPMPESGEEIVALGEKLTAQAVKAHEQNSKHPVVAAIMAASGLSGAAAAPAPLPDDELLKSLEQDLAPAPEPAAAQEPLIDLQPGEEGIPEHIAEKFIGFAAKCGIEANDLIYINGLATGRRTLMELTSELAHVLHQRILVEAQERLDGRGTFAPSPPVTHGTYDGPTNEIKTETPAETPAPAEEPPSPFQTFTSDSIPDDAPTADEKSAEPFGGKKAEPFKAKYAPNEILGPALKDARERVNLTVEQAAEITKLKAAAIQAYEDGNMRPQGKTIGVFAKAYDCDETELGQGRVSPLEIQTGVNTEAAAQVGAPDEMTPPDFDPNPGAPAEPKDDAGPPWAEPPAEPGQTNTPERPANSDFVGRNMTSQAYAEAEMKKARLPIPQEPETEAPDMPRDISKLNEVDLRSVHATYHFYYARAAWLASCEEADYEAADTVHEYEMDKHMLELERAAPSRSVTMIKAEAAQDPIVVKWGEQVRAHRARMRAFKSARDIYLATVDRCSREFAVRGMDKRTVPS